MASVLFSRVPDVLHGVSGAVLSPWLSGPLLLAVTRAPDTFRDSVMALASRVPSLRVSACSDLSIAATILRILFALSLVRQANLVLNDMARNSWRLRSPKGWDWPNEIAVVTGGSSGIGKAIVQKLVALHVRVVVLDIQDLPKDLQDNPRVSFYHCDVSSGKSVASAAEDIRRDIGHPSILINNAGITQPNPILKVPESFLRKIFGVNCLSHWFTTQQFLPRMIQVNKGHVVTIGSISSYVALPTAADYSATKAAALAFHESLACELKHYYKAPSVLTTVVLPNFVRTPLLDVFGDRLESSGVSLLKTEDVAELVVAQVERKRGGHLIIPESASVISGIRGWPSWLQEVIRDALGRTTSQM